MAIPALSDVVRSSTSTSAFAAGGGGTPGGSSGDIQFNNGGAFAGATNVQVENGNLRLDNVSAEPVAPVFGGIDIYSLRLAGKPFVAFRDRDNHIAKTSSRLQTSLMQGGIVMLVPNINAASWTAIGSGNPTATGTITTRNVAATNFATRMQRVAYVSAATAGALAGPRLNSAVVTVGTGSTGLGGFFVQYRFMISDAAAVAGARMFIGLSSSTGAPTNVEPSTLTQCIGFGHGAADTTLRFYRGGSTAQTPIDLGANFPVDTRNTDVYEATLFSPTAWVDENGTPTSGQTVIYQVTRLNTGHTIMGSVSGQLPAVMPATTQLLTPLQAWRSNNATALAVAIDFMAFYCELTG